MNQQLSQEYSKRNGKQNVEQLIYYGISVYVYILCNLLGPFFLQN